jgi:hypothetical protein
MFLCSIRMSKIKIFAVFAAILAVGILSIVLITSSSNANKLPGTMPPAEMMTAETNDQRVAFLEYFGWKVVAEPTEVAEVAVPNEFDDVYQSYNDIQRQQGLDLEGYKGKTVQRYVYLVTNYPDEKKNVFAHLLVCDNVIIGGDIASSELNGFMHGFIKP